VVLIVLLISLMPFLLLALPAGVVTALFGFFWLVLIYASLAPVAGRWSLAISVLVPATQLLLQSDELATAVTLLAGCAVGPLLVRNGLRVREVVGLALVLLVYDVLVTTVAGVMSEMAVRLATLPFFLGLRLGEGFVGGADIALCSVFVATLAARHGRPTAYAGAVLLALPLAGAAYVPALAGQVLPYLVFASPVFLFVLWSAWAVEMRRRARQAGSTMTSAARPGESPSA